jgi:hypothetical protein
MREIEAAYADRRPPDFDTVEPIRWATAVDALFAAGAIDATAHAVRHLYARCPDVDYVRNLFDLFERMPPRGDLPFEDDRSRDVQVVKRAGADTAMILFSGAHGRLGMPLAAIHRWLARMNCSLVYLRDFRRLYYQAGVPSLGPTRAATVAGLRRITAALGALDVVTYGNSGGGGFAALQYAVELEARSAVSFAGATNLSLAFNAHLSGVANKIRGHEAVRDATLDLRPLYAAVRDRPRAFLVCAEHFWDDRLHAEHLAGLPAVTIEIVAGCDQHNVSRELIRRGQYQAFLDRVMQRN